MKVLVADPIAREGIEVLKKEFEVDVKTGLKPDELKAIIGNYDALVVRSETQVTPEIIEAGKRLQVIGRAGVGLDAPRRQRDVGAVVGVDVAHAER